VLKRVLLVYNEAANRLETGKDLPPNVIPAAAKLLRQFIEQYHEKLEEDYGSIRLRSKRPARPPTGTHSEAGGPLSVFFLDQLDAAVDQIPRNPGQYPSYDFGTRRMVLRRFAFVIIFREAAVRVEIIAIAHGRRRPGYWQDRPG
jgi:hypothetical protein